MLTAEIEAAIAPIPNAKPNKSSSYHTVVIAQLHDMQAANSMVIITPVNCQGPSGQQVARWRVQGGAAARQTAPWLPYHASWCSPRWLRLMHSVSTGRSALLKLSGGRCTVKWAKPS